MRRIGWTRGGLLVVVVGVLGGGCGPSAGPSAGGGSARDTLTIGGYSVIKEAFHDALRPAFARLWKAKTGREVDFVESYEASGAQSRKIAAGTFEADIAALSLEDDVRPLVEKGLVKPDWNTGPDQGVITHSLVVIGVRPGNPKGIKTWDDLAKAGVGVLYPDPKTSGGARWNVNALYGSALLTSKEAHGGTADLATVGEALKKVQANVVNMDSSGRASVATFERGTGDALVTYENEILLRKKQGKPIEYVIPERTLLIESPAAIVEASVAKHKNREVAEAFLAFVRSAEGQKLLGEYGFRPVDPKANDTVAAPLPARLFTMADLGGWDGVRDTVYGPKGIWTSVFTALAGGK